ncbi:hypothetical protein [Falsigemmobacter faecalis]|nr:hypothetical protein [Falsigemmobacter faecalis]
MKAILFGAITAAVLAGATWQMSQAFQIPAHVAYATEGARVTPPTK